MALESQSIPAPTGGWNTKDSRDFLDPSFARELTNWFPDTGQVVTRKGYRSHSSAMGSSYVETLASFTADDGTETLVSGANSNLYNATTYGGSGSSVGSGYTNDRWQSVSFKSRLWLCNGEDQPVYWTGSALGSVVFGAALWTTSTAYVEGDQVYFGTNIYEATTAGTSGGTPPTHTTSTASDGGVTWLFRVSTTSFINVTAHKSRLYWVEKDSCSIWYAGVNSITGEITEFDVGGVFRTGGYIEGCASLSRSTGDGDQNQLIIFGSSGEALVYSGSYPGDSAWSLVRRVRLPRLLGRRAWTELGSDLVCITRAGLYAFNELLGGKPAGTETPISDKVNDTFIRWAADYSANFGWSVVNYPEDQKLIVNIPKTSSASYQLVFNTLSGAACLYDGINAKSWATHKNSIYFGGIDGKVYQSEYGYTDGSNSISHLLKQAWSYAGNRATLKKFAAVKPLLETSTTTTIEVGVDTDFVDSSNSVSADLSKSTTAWASPWGSAWTEPSAVFNSWIPISATGKNYSLKLAGVLNGGQLEFVSSQVLYDQGGVK